MCINPSNIEVNGESVQVGCRLCWQCRKNRVNDLVGRCIAEQQTASQTLAVTLTYTDEAGANAAVLVYKDVQDFMKRFRKGGYTVRYIVAGEYGSQKGRAHWHAIFFLYGNTLNVVEDPKERGEWDIILPRYDDDPWARIQWAPWSSKSEGRGFAYFQQPDYGGFRYLLKYVLKDQSQSVSITHLAMSKKPPLGYAYFMENAAQHVAQGVLPQSPDYSFADFDSNGKRRRYYLQGRMRELWIERIDELWREKRGEPISNEWYELMRDKVWDRNNPPEPENFDLEAERARLDENTRRVHRARDVEQLQHKITTLAERVGEQQAELEALEQIEYFEGYIGRRWLSVWARKDRSELLAEGYHSKWLVKGKTKVARALRWLQVHRSAPLISLSKIANGGKSAESSLKSLTWQLDELESLQKHLYSHQAGLWKRKRGDVIANARLQSHKRHYLTLADAIDEIRKRHAAAKTGQKVAEAVAAPEPSFLGVGKPEKGA